jgi:NADH:ubiquinone oxidoreductase subunit 3 (subunit A)
MAEILLYPIVTLFMVFVSVLLLYAFAGTLGPEFKGAKYKLTSYACGEDATELHKQHSYSLFHVAFFFTVLHVGALLISTVPKGGEALLGIMLIASMGITAFALYGSDKHA